ncbi:PKD domain-containing protein [Microbacterium sp. 4R-513]|uniref:PKD domain-containing protein n=1 Tax=Microbacterium sp. 4R-513 TaxID=2567934 RepID=UPI0013E1BFEE|nr:PKD domain-containing protein [Microbacterium sp. 4R-513]QIG38799.1 PKD domain-containing protein [Microbacterium sp. 4R-513]
MPGIIRDRMGVSSRRITASLVAVAMIVATLALVVVPSGRAAAADPPALPDTVTTDVLPTWQINGVVWSQAVVGNTVYVTGSFTKARPPGVAVGGAGEIDAQNIFAFDITTGNPIPNFTHSLDAQGLVVRAAPDGKTVYFGGDFTTVDGQARSHVAAFDVATGALVSWAPRTDGQVRGFAFSGSTVYVGGNFRSSGGQPRTELAAWDTTTGTLTAWAPVAAGDGFVWDMVSSPDRSRVIIAGSFTQLNGQTAYGMGSLDAATGNAMPWAAVSTIKTAGLNGAISSLSTDGTQVFGTGYAFGAGASFEGTFAADPYTGKINWINDCLGDTYSSFPQGQVLYSVGHRHDCTVVGGFPDTSPRSRWQKATAEPTFPVGTITTKDAYGWDFTGNAYAGLLHWYPDLEFGSYTDARQAAWSVTGNSDYIVLGGEFPKVNTTAQQGLVRFARRPISPHAVAPINSTAFTPAPYSNEAGTVRVPFSSVWDRDNTAITYDVFRSPATKIATFTRNDSEFWRLPSLSITDTGQTPGAQVRYQVRAKDADGNVQWSAWSPYITVSGAAASTYRTAVRASAPTHYWRLGETLGTKLYDDVGDAPGTLLSLTLGASGALTNDVDAAVTSAGGSNPRMTTTDSESTTAATSVEAWVKTTSTRGGRIVGYGNSSTGTSASGLTDRVLYLDTSGRANFAINDGSYRTVYSRGSVNDGQWHHIVGTVGTGGMELYVDGIRVGRDQSATTPKSYIGYWRIGADQTGSFTNRPSDAALSGSIDDVAVYAKALTKGDVQAHYAASGRTGSWTAAPADAYGAAVSTDAPDLYWRLNETASGPVRDFAVGGSTGNQSGSVTRSQPGAISGDTATTFNGLLSGLVVAQEATNAPTAFTAEVWFKTTSTTGGKLVGFGNAASGLSTNYDRHIVMQSNGRVSFGVNNGSQTSVVSPAAYNDGLWHYAVASQGPDGMKLWVDTKLVGSNGVTTAQNYRGYWRIGGDRTFGSTSSNYITGTLDEVAVYPGVLSEDRIRSHFAAAGRTPGERAPVASFTATTNELAVNVDASASTDADGNIVSYDWTFGDGSTAAGVTAAHTYAQAGTYTVTLKVTDATSLVSSTTKSVTVAPNKAPTAAFTSTVTNLSVAFDASASADSDGTIAGYAWDFGDGQTGTGATATHVYAGAGTFAVKLTVTDDDGAVGTITKSVTTSQAPNTPPVAAFTATTDLLTASLDGSSSSDTDGTVASYAWDFGDASTGTGSTAQHMYAAAGTYTVTLTVTDDRGATNTVTHPVSVVANQAPTASFTSTSTDLTASVDGSGSTDADGSVASYAWDFGDGSTGSGATASHPYAAAGTYTVTLTVTDNRGATNSTSKPVTVTAPLVWAKDSFERTATNGWGTAEVGGAWTMNPGTATALSKFSVADGVGKVTLSAGNSYTASLAGAAPSTSTEERFTVAVNQVSTGGGYYFSAIGRQIDNLNDYRAKVRVASNGAVALWLTRTVGGAETVLTSLTLPGVSVTTPDSLSIRLQVSGVNATTLKAKVWRTATAEPAAWTLTATDSTAVLQAPGYVGINSYLSSSATTVPVVYSYDGFFAGPAQ